MPGETELRTLLSGMTPVLRREEYVFCTLPPGEPIPDGIVPFATVREAEGLTIVVRRSCSSGLRCSAPFRVITLAVQSGLDAVGFVAAVSRALADANHPANVLAGYHHDHVLVPAADAVGAMRVLADLSASTIP